LCKLDYPFDENLFKVGVNNSVKINSGDEEKCGELVDTITMSEVNRDSLKLIIDMKKNHSVKLLKLQFGRLTDGENFHFRVLVWGSVPNSSIGNNFDFINKKSYYDNIWKQLTKFENMKNENGFFKSNDYRSLNIDNINYSGRYLCIEIQISQYQRICKDFPTKLKIIPEVFGNINNDIDNYEYSSMSNIFSEFENLKEDTLRLNDKQYLCRNIKDNHFFVTNNLIHCGNNKGTTTNNTTNTNIKPLSTTSNTNTEVDEKDSNINNNESNIENLKKNLHSYQTTLLFNVLDAIERNEIMDNDSSGKTNLIISDIVSIQEKLSTHIPTINISESLSFNINIILGFVNEIKSLTSVITAEEITEIVKASFNNDLNLIYEFIKNFTEICILNETGTVRIESLNFIKNIFWPIIETDLSLTSKLFESFVEEYMSKDKVYRSALQIVESFSLFEFGIDEILTHLTKSFKYEWKENQISDAFYNISCLMFLLLKKIKIKAKNVEDKCINIIEVNLEFLRYLTKESKFNSDINQILLTHCLNVS